MSRAPALLASALLHAGLFGALVFWPDRAEPPPPPPVPVKLVPPPPDGPAEVSTAPEPSPEPPALAAEPEPTPSEPPPPTPPRPTPSPPQQTRPAPPRPPPPRPAPAPRPTPPRATPPAKPASSRPTPRSPEQPLDLSALGQRLARNEPRAAPKSAGATPGQLAAARADLGARLQRLWRPNCGADGGLAVNVRVRFRLRDGRIQGSPSIVGGASDDGVVRAAQERALAAVRSAEPYDWLPEEMQDGDYQPSFNAEQACG